MGIDKETKPTYVGVLLDSNSEYIDELKKDAKEKDMNEGKKVPQIYLSLDGHTFEPDEYYYDEGNNELVISGKMVSPKGRSFISINIPLSSTVLMDILQGTIKKFNRIKTMIETLK